MHSHKYKCNPQATAAIPCTNDAYARVRGGQQPEDEEWGTLQVSEIDLTRLQDDPPLAVPQATSAALCGRVIADGSQERHDRPVSAPAQALKTRRPVGRT